MPLQKLCNKPAVVEQFCVCSQEVQGTNFITHVGLASEQQCGIKYGDTVKWTHVFSFFRRAEDRVHVIGKIRLSAEERESMDIFITDCEEEIEKIKRFERPKQFIIFPHKEERSAERPYCRYSCAGFVLEAYRRIHVTILEEDVIPAQSLDFLDEYYPGLAECSIKEREALGLIGTGPWRVVLPGYVLNAFNRSEKKIRQEPFRPKVSHSFFREPFSLKDVVFCG